MVRVTVHHIIRGENGEEDIELEHEKIESKGKIGETYTTKAIEIEHYRLEEQPSNATGEYMKTDIDVYYYYVNSEYKSLAVKKVWEMPNEEADNYKATIQLMKVVDGKKVPVKNKDGGIYTIEIIGNHTKSFENLPLYYGKNLIEYAVSEIKIEKKASDGEKEWEDVPMENFYVKYQDKKDKIPLEDGVQIEE